MALSSFLLKRLLTKTQGYLSIGGNDQVGMNYRYWHASKQRRWLLDAPAAALHIPVGTADAVVRVDSMGHVIYSFL